MSTHIQVFELNAFRKFATATAFGYFPKYGKARFLLLFSFSFLSYDAHIYCSSCAEFDTYPKHHDTTKCVKSVYFVVHFTHMLMHICVATHTHTCKFWLEY